MLFLRPVILSGIPSDVYPHTTQSMGRFMDVVSGYPILLNWSPIFVGPTMGKGKDGKFPSVRLPNTSNLSNTESTFIAQRPNPPKIIPG